MQSPPPYPGFLPFPESGAVLAAASLEAWGWPPPPCAVHRSRTDLDSPVPGEALAERVAGQRPPTPPRPGPTSSQHCGQKGGQAGPAQAGRAACITARGSCCRWSEAWPCASNSCARPPHAPCSPPSRSLLSAHVSQPSTRPCEQVADSEVSVSFSWAGHWGCLAPRQRVGLRARL